MDSHTRGLYWDSSAKDACVPPLAGGGQPNFCSAFNSIHFGPSVQRRYHARGRYSTGGNKDKVKSDYVFKKDI